MIHLGEGKRPASDSDSSDLYKGNKLVLSGGDSSISNAYIYYYILHGNLTGAHYHLNFASNPQKD